MLKISQPSTDLQLAIAARLKSAEPIINDTTLENGARYLTACVSNSPVSSIAVHFDAGSRREATSENGSLRFYEHLLPATFRIANGGTNLLQLAKEHAWEVKIEITQDRLAFGFICPDFDAKSAISILDEMLSYPADLCGQVFETEKGRILNEIYVEGPKNNRMQRQFLAELLMASTGYQNPEPGRPEMVSQYTFNNVMAIGERFLSPANATVTISGSADLIAYGRNAFSQMTFRGSGPRQPQFSVSERPAWENLPLSSTHRYPYIPGVQLDLVLRGPTSFCTMENLALDVIVNHLSSVVGRRISHESGLTYNAGATGLWYGDVSFITAGCNLDPKYVSKAIKLIEDTVREFPAMLTEDIVTKTQLRERNTAYKDLHKSHYGEELAYLAVHPNRAFESPTDRLAGYSALTLDGIKDVAKRYLTPGDYKIVIHGSDEAIAEIE